MFILERTPDALALTRNSFMPIAQTLLTWLHKSVGASLGRRLAASVLLFSAAVTLLSAAIQLGVEYRRDVSEIAARLHQVRSSYADSLAASVWTANPADLELQLSGILRVPDLQYVEVFDEQGAMLARAGRSLGEEQLSDSFPLYFTQRNKPVYLGRVRVEANPAGAWRRLQSKVPVILATQSLQIFLLALFILLLFQRQVGRHLKQIAADADRLSAGGMDQPLRLDRPAGRPVQDELAQMVTAMNAMRERLHQSFQQLQESEFRWKSALEGAGHGVWDFNIQTGVVLYSRRWKEMLGFAEHELPNHLDTYKRLAHPDDQRVAFRLLEANFNGSSRNYAIEQRMMCKDGSWKWVVARGMVVEQDEHGNAVRMIGTHTDFTERRNAEVEMTRLLEAAEAARGALRHANETMESQVRERTAQLERANKELEAFSYSVSHDLRSPLRGIDGWSLALEEDYGAQLDATAREYLQRIRAEAGRMGQLIDGMLEFARLSRTALAPRRIDLSALAATVAQRIREAHPERQIEFTLQPGLHASADPRLLEAVLHNLLENASKFAAARTPARVAFGRAWSIEPASGNAVEAFYVRDNGAGFDMQFAAKLFGVFQRLHRSSEFPGTGIGLATVQRIVQRHGGVVWAEAAPEAGATFYFTLGETK